MRDEEIFGLLIDTNPVSDPDGLDSPLALADLGKRRVTMQIQQPTRPTRDVPKRRRALVGVSVFFVVVAVGVGFFLAGNTDDGAVDAADAAPTEVPSVLASTGDLDHLPGTSWARTDDPQSIECCLDQLMVLHFALDGTFTFNRPSGGREDAGTYTVDEGEIAFTSDQGYTCAGTVGHFTFSFHAPGRASLHVVSDECGRVDTAGEEFIQIPR
jgi:hypothetical protein